MTCRVNGGMNISLPLLGANFGLFVMGGEVEPELLEPPVKVSGADPDRRP